jgi:hypothetical protein
MVSLDVFGFWVWLVVGWAAAMLYVIAGIAVILLLDQRFGWFHARLERQGLVADLLVLAVWPLAVWPLMILWICLSHWLRTKKHGRDGYSEKAAA